MSFWAQRLTQPAPQTPAPAAPAAAPGRAWWQPGAGLQPQAPVAPQQVQQVPQTVVPQPQQVQQTPDGKVPIGELLRQDNYTTTKAQSAKDSESCPDCGSNNYVRSSQSPNSMKTCFDCGFNPRFLHSTHGASGIGQQDLPQYVARSQSAAPSDVGAVIAHI